MKKSTKEKLREHAIKNGLGGYVEKEHVCEQCGEEFKGTPNQLRCKGCINKGYLLECKHCDSNFNSKYKNTKYCDVCVEKRVWIKDTRPDEVGEKISKAKKKWYKTEEGKRITKEAAKKRSKTLKKYFKTEEGKRQIKETAKIQSKVMKEKIKNGEFTPNITNSFTHWEAVIKYDDGKTKKFRSSWEACFWYCNQNLKYESKECRVYSKEYDRTFIGDFFDEKDNIFYEIKPKKYYLKQSNKIDTMIEYCKENGYKFKWINEFNIINYIDKSVFEGNNKKQLNKLLEGIDEKD